MEKSNNTHKTYFEAVEEFNSAVEELFLEICDALYINDLVEYLNNKLVDFSRK